MDNIESTEPNMDKKKLAIVIVVLAIIAVAVTLLVKSRQEWQEGPDQRHTIVWPEEPPKDSNTVWPQ